MLSLGLTSSQYRQYMRVLATGYEMKTTVQILTPEHQVVRTVSHILMDGQVDVTTPKMENGEVAVSRICMLQFLDPDQSLALDSASPADGAFYMDRMVRVVVSVRVPPKIQYAKGYGSGDYGEGPFGVSPPEGTVVTPGYWVDTPVFTGPIVKVDRDGDLVDVECQGKEWYAKQSAWDVFTVKGLKNVVIRALMYRVGEQARYMDLPTTGTKASVAVGREDSIWSHAWRVNSSMNRLLFYDGRGVLRSVPKPSKTAVVLREGAGEFIHESAQVTYSTENLVNAVRVEGARPSKGKPVPVARAVAPTGHPLALVRNGERIRKGEFIQNGDLKSNAACRALAVSELEDGLMQQVEATVTTKPIYHLEPWDIIQVATRRLSVRFRPASFTIPLVQRSGAGKPMSIGFTYRATRPRRRKRVA